MDKYIGKRLDGRYEILEIIGVGGMAVVYKAHDMLDDRTVAVKILKNEYLGNEEFRKRFKNECKAIAVLNHSNIIKVYDVSFGNRVEYIVMEYVDGITLKEYIEQQGVIKWKETVFFIEQILAAIQHAHDKGIVHRDLKPQNIMLLPDGTVKVADFGIARFSRNMEQTFNSERAIGSVHYISPEQASGAMTDAKADLYSIGVMLYEMLTGKLPFDAETAVSVAIMQMQSSPAMPREVNPSVPEGLEGITIHAMQKDPAKRYQSAAEMLRDIEDFKNNPSIHFEYKYFVDQNPTRYVDSINRVRTIDSKEEAVAAVKTGDPEQSRKKNLRMLTIIIIAVVLFVAGLIVFGVVIWNKLSGVSTNSINVPNVVGMTIEEAQAQYPDFVFELEKREYNEIEENKIISQNPDNTKKAEKGSVITVVVSSGSKKVTIPATIVGMELSQAEARLNGLNVKYKIIDKADNDTAAGRVITTNPAPGSEVSTGTEVIVYVSTGPNKKETTVPGVVGLSEADAKKALESKNLKTTESKEVDSDLAKGKVISCDPAEGTKLYEGDTVTLTISSGNKPRRDVTFDVDLPNTATTVYLRVFVNHIEQDDLRTSGIIPSGAKNYSFTINGTGTAKVIIQIGTSPNGSFANYRELTVDFDNNDYTIDRKLPFVEPGTGTGETSSHI